MTAGVPKLSCKGEPDNDLCAVNVEHRHCVCKLPMAVDAEFCDLCLAEGLVLGPELEGAEWDGKTYPSFRRHRTICPTPDNYIVLFQAVSGDRSTFMHGVATR